MKKSLFDNIKLGNTTLKNRFALSPMTRISASFEGTPSDTMQQYYTSFAKGGFGLIITEGTYIDTQYSQTYKYQPGIALQEHIDAWSEISNSVKKFDAKIIMQIQHSGSLSQGNRFVNSTLAPSVVQPKGEQLDFYFGNGAYRLPIEAAKQDIKNVIESFGQAAYNAQKAGMDGIEIHAANGYLLDQFLTPYTNVRIDEYGGNIQNRLRIIIEVIKEIKKVVKKDFIVGIRLSQGKVNDYSHKWSDETEAETIFKSIEKAGVDYIHITEYDVLLPAFDKDVYKSPIALTLVSIAKNVTSIPIIANGQIDSLSKSNDIVSSGTADIVAIGKAALANHDFPTKLFNEEGLEQFDPLKTLRPTAQIKDFEIV